MIKSNQRMRHMYLCYGVINLMTKFGLQNTEHIDANKHTHSYSTFRLLKRAKLTAI